MPQHTTRHHLDLAASDADIEAYRRTRDNGSRSTAAEIKEKGNLREDARIEFYNTVENIVQFVSAGSGIARDRLPPVFQNMGGRLPGMNEDRFQNALAQMREEAVRIGAIQLKPDKHSSDRQNEQRNQGQWERLLDDLYDRYREYKRCSAQGQARS